MSTDTKTQDDPDTSIASATSTQSSGAHAIHPEQLTMQRWLELLNEIGFGPGLADIVTVGPDPMFVRARNLVQMGLFLVHEGTRLFDTVCVLSPPTWPSSVDLRAMVAFHLSQLDEVASSAEAHAARVDHRKLSGLDTEELLNELRSCPDRSLIYVPSAADFRYVGATTTSAGEEPWIAQFVQLTNDAKVVVTGTSSYVLLDAGRFMPPGPHIKKSFEEFGCGHVGAPRASEQVGRLAAAVDGISGSDPQAVSETLAAITDAEGALDPDSASLLRAITLHNAGQHLMAWAVLSPRWEPLLEYTSNEPSARVELARIATVTGAHAEARRALASFEVDAVGATVLERVLLVADACNERALEAKVRARLERVFPRSQVLGAHLVRSRLVTGDYEVAGKLLSETMISLDPGERAYLTDLVAHLRPDVSDYMSVSDALIAHHPARENEIRLLAAREAARHRDYNAAFHLYGGIDPATPDGSRATRLALDVLESVLVLRGEEGAFAVSDTQLARLVAAFAKRVAVAPRNVSLRISFARVLSVEVLGARGFATLAYLLTGRPVEPEPAPRTTADVVEESETEEFFKLAHDQINQPGATVILGTGRLPDSFDPERARRLVRVLPAIFDRMLDSSRGEEHLLGLNMALHTSLLICERAGDRAHGINLLRGVAVHLAATGSAQLARDMVEHGLSLAGADVTELRAAWTAYADVYHRVGDLHGALIGALLATSCGDARLSLEQAWLEGYLLTRLLRDLGLCDVAEEVLTRSIRMIGALTRGQAVRIESLRLSIVQRRFERGPFNNETLLELLRPLTANLRDAVDLQDDVLPPLTMLVDLTARARRHELNIPDEIDDLIRKALALVPNLAERVTTFGVPRPSLADVLRLARGVSKTRFGEHIAYDIMSASTLAKRMLAHTDQIPINEALVVLDLLSDRTLVEPGGREVVDLHRIRGAVAHLRRHGHDVHLLALDERERLVRLTLPEEGPEVIVHESEDVFSAARFEQWKTELPFKYASMDHSEHVMADAVRRSVDQLGISAPPQRSTVVVCDVELQPFPMNLLRYQDEFVGALRPIAMAPSLDWVADVIERPRPPNGRTIAWVSDAIPTDDLGRSVLAPLAERLEPILTERGVSLTRAEQPPLELTDADLAIVLAHGGLVPGQRFFQVLSDDHDKQWTPREIGRALGAAGIVVLFVCSSGRLDERPRARATVGLTRHLLENGCRAVVACPWPLNVLVPPHWLPRFLDGLNSGARATDAVFAANQELVSRFSGNPPHAFAMHLYGDPSFRLK